jgi:hypothetical protein
VARTLDVDAFMLMCFVETLGVMLRVKCTSGATCTPSTSSTRHQAKVGRGGATAATVPPSQAWQRKPSAASSGASAVRMPGLLAPTDECFGAYRWLHRLVDVLQRCNSSSSSGSAAQMSLVADLATLNVVRAFVQLGVRHTISVSTLRLLHADTRVARVAPELAQLVDALLTPDLTLVQPLEPMRVESGRKRALPQQQQQPSSTDRVPIVFTDALRMALCQRNAAHPLLAAPSDVATLWLFYELVLRNQVRLGAHVDYALARTVLYDLRSDDPLTEARWQRAQQQQHTTVLTNYPQSLSYYVREGWRTAPYVTDERFVSEDIGVREPCVALLDFVRQLEYRHTTGKLDTSDVGVLLPHGAEHFVVAGADSAAAAAAPEPPTRQPDARACTAASALAFTYAESEGGIVAFDEMFLVVQSPTIARALHTEPRNADARARQRAMNSSVDLVCRFAHRFDTVALEVSDYQQELMRHNAAVAARQQQQQTRSKAGGFPRSGAAPHRYAALQAPLAPQPYASLQTFESAKWRYESTLVHEPSDMDADQYFADAQKMARTSAVAPALSSSV